MTKPRMPRKTKKAFRKFDRQLGLRERRRITRIFRWMHRHLDKPYAFWIPVKRRPGTPYRTRDVALFALKVGI
jgi:hypothetical protein